MTDHSGERTSIWMATQDVPQFPTLSRNIETGVCIVGAGIAGLTTAYLLRREGQEVVVLDDGPILSGETERTTAHLVSALDDRFFELERLHGDHGARLAAESHTAAINKIEEIVRSENIACDFERLDGYLFVPRGESTEILDRELEAARRAGLSVTKVPRAPIPLIDTGPALQFLRQGQFHPTKYLSALARAIVRDGGQIFAHTHATKVEGGRKARVETANSLTIHASAVVVATNTPINDRVTIHTKQAPYRTYVIAARVPRGSVTKALYWDTPDPYHYVRLQAVGRDDLLIVGGEDHKTGQAADGEERFQSLEEWTRERFPIERVQYRWSGQIIEPVDCLAFIGPNPGDKENVFIATGDSGNGMTHGTIAGILLTDLISRRANPWSELYDPSRKPIGRHASALTEYTRENANVLAQYRDYVTPGDLRLNEGLPPLDSGAVVRRGLKKVAVYCDDAGNLHECSAVCPHMGCVVAWNPVEKTWDCPCHGSRFDRYGKVVNGPANTDLQALEHEPQETPAHA
jgi:glycine/D-amino acid oxidase-like deaminating enzyme/nitrite reductase/ring-hydroxylating ferredoxin subunit